MLASHPLLILAAVLGCIVALDLLRIFLSLRRRTFAAERRAASLSELRTRERRAHAQHVEELEVQLRESLCSTFDAAPPPPECLPLGSLDALTRPRYLASALVASALMGLSDYPADAPDYDAIAVELLRRALSRLVPGLWSETIGRPGPPTRPAVPWLNEVLES